MHARRIEQKMIVKNDFKVRHVQITTKRLVLRPWKTTDLESYHKYACSDASGEMTDRKPHRSVSESKHVLNKMINHNAGLAITLKGTDIVVGTIDAERLNGVRNKGEEADKLEKMVTGRRCVQISVTLSPNMRGVGLGQEVVNALCKWLEEYRKLQIIYAEIRKGNAAAAHIFEKYKFTQFDEVQEKDEQEKAVTVLRYARICQDNLKEQ